MRHSPTAGLVALAWLVAGGPVVPGEDPRRPAPSRPGLSWKDSDSLAGKLEAIAKRPKGARPQPLTVTEGELNSYVNLAMAQRLPAGISAVDLKIEDGRFTAKAMIDLDHLRDRLPPTGAFNPMTYLSGQVPVEVRSRFESADGFGTMQPEEVRLGGYLLPISFLQQMVLQSTRSTQTPEGVDILAPFRLPYSVKRVRLRTGKAVLEP